MPRAHTPPHTTQRRHTAKRGMVTPLAAAFQPSKLGDGHDGSVCCCPAPILVAQPHAHPALYIIESILRTHAAHAHNCYDMELPASCGMYDQLSACVRSAEITCRLAPRGTCTQVAACEGSTKSNRLQTATAHFARTNFNACARGTTHRAQRTRAGLAAQHHTRATALNSSKKFRHEPEPAFGVSAKRRLL